MKKVIIIFLFIILQHTSWSQESYLIFEKHIGINKEIISPNLFVSQNDIQLKKKDTTMQIFNFLYTTDRLKFKWGDINSSLKKFDDYKATLSNILITAVPLIKPGEKLILKKLNRKELALLKITTHKNLLEKSLPDLYVHFTEHSNNMPSLKTLDLGLIIKDGDNYFKVQQKVLTTKYILYYTQAYFPNQFKDGSLIIPNDYSLVSNKPFLKTYQLTDIQKMLNELKGTLIINEIYDKIYLSSVIEMPNLKEYIFNFWEFPNGDVESIFLNPVKLKQYHPGLGSFSFLNKIGVINCSLDFYLYNKVLFNQKETFEIITINSLILEKFKENYNSSISKSQKVIWNEN